MDRLTAISKRAYNPSRTRVSKQAVVVLIKIVCFIHSLFLGFKTSSN